MITIKRNPPIAPRTPDTRKSPLLPRVVRMVVVSTPMLLACRALPAQDLTGRWVYEESGQLVELDVRHDRPNGRATGTFAMFGRSAAFEGVIAAGTLVIQRLGDVQASAENGVITARLQTPTLMLTVTQPGQAPVTLPMTRRGDPASAPGPLAGATPPRASATPDAGFRPGTASEFSGQWQFSSSDGTSGEEVTLAVRGMDVTGEATAYERSYFTGRTTVTGRVMIRGTLTNGALQLRLWTPDRSPNEANPATGRLRGEYFILLAKNGETAYARPDRSLVQSAEGSPEAAALARAVIGNVYSQSSQARGREGAMVGKRIRLALCSNGDAAYDWSDVGVVPGGDGGMGKTITRRGRWSIVLYGGTPMVQAKWDGTGTSYSLIAFFRVRPDPSGRSANVDGTDLPLTERC